MSATRVDQETHPLSALKLWEANRDPRWWKVRKLASEWDERKLQPLEVFPDDETDSYLMGEGQHRYLAMRELGYSDDYPVRCNVHSGYARAEMYGLVRAWNDKLTPSSIDDFKWALGASDPQAIEIEAVYSAFGYTLTRSRTPHSISCPAALIAIHSLGGRSLLADVMHIVTGAWNASPDSARDAILSGIALVLNRDPSLDRAALIRNLTREGTALALYGKAKTLRDVRGGKLAHNVAELVVETYNIRRRTKRLKPWERT